LKDAINPNLVQTLENTPAIIHGGPFANIAHGCNSIIATKLALKLGDYVITEAGFGADLGAEKFVDVKCRVAGLKPSAAVVVATLKALKYHGGADVDSCKEENLEALECGLENVLKHVDNIKNVFGLYPIVAINKYYTDTDKEIEFLKEKLEKEGIEVSIANTWAEGGKGTTDLAEKVVKAAEKNVSDITFTYDLNETVENKIRAVARRVYGADDIILEDKAIAQIENINDLGYDKLPVCIAKTQYSFSDDPKKLIIKEDDKFKITVKSVEVRGGAEFIVVKTGKVMTMPGLPKVPAAESIDVTEDGEIVGLF
jgi:formate--tetrahydrofolate ligase